MNPYENLGPRYAPAPGLMQDSLRAHGVFETVRVLWDRKLEVFEVQGWGPESKQWVYCFYWAHYPKTGGIVPRELPATCTPLLEWMARIDDARFGKTPEQNRRLAWKEMDDSRAERLAKLQRARREQALSLGVDFANHRSGQKQVFGSGYIRSRAHWQQSSPELDQARAELSALQSG